MRRCAVLCLAAAAAFAEDPSDPQKPHSRNGAEYSCGNCWKEVGGVKALCNTQSDPSSALGTDFGVGNGSWYVRPDFATTNQFKDLAKNFPPGTFQITKAQAYTVGGMKTLLGDKFNGLFCRGYLNRYKDGSAGAASGSGAACVREPTAQAIMKADNDARAAFQMFGTSDNYAWGYPSSYAVDHGQTPADVQQFGTGRGGDIPPNWCGPFMREMLCHIAFPQVLGPVNDGETSVAKIAEGRIRPVDSDNCAEIFGVCMRREPQEIETYTDYVPPETQNHHAPIINKKLHNHVDLKRVWPKVEGAMKVDRWCNLWQSGWGLARAGTSVAEQKGCVRRDPTDAGCYGSAADPNPNIVNWRSDIREGRKNDEWNPAKWEAASGPAVSLLVAVVAAFAVVLLH